MTVSSGKNQALPALMASAEDSGNQTVEISELTTQLESLSLTQLRKKARATPGISEKKKTEEGKWVPKQKEDLVADFQALQEHFLLPCWSSCSLQKKLHGWMLV